MSRTVAIEVAVAVAIVVAIVVARVCRPHGVTDVNTDTDTECLQHTQGAAGRAHDPGSLACGSLGRLGRLGQDEVR